MKAVAMPEKPLFVPLFTVHYDRFADGSKKTELRRYGSRWNENTCRIGRPATLSRGYGKRHRLNGEVVSFARKPGCEFHGQERLDILEIYGTLDMDIAIIGIDVDEVQQITMVR